MLCMSYRELNTLVNLTVKECKRAKIHIISKKFNQVICVILLSSDGFILFFLDNHFFQDRKDNVTKFFISTFNKMISQYSSGICMRPAT